MNELEKSAIQIGQYTLGKSIGEGGMAIVYEAQGPAGQAVAIKIIRAEYSSNDAFVRRFNREAQTVAGLSHPHILRVYAHGLHEGKPYLVMQQLDGGDLASKLHQAPLSMAQVQRWFGHIADALAYAHSRGLVHRDLKPSNILLNAGDEAVLSDFGLVKLAADSPKQTLLTQAGAQLGTPAYMSPEQWRGADADARSDLYALGLLLYEMLAGVLPFNSENMYDLMQRHLFMQPPSLRKLRPDLPGGLETVLRRALAKDPDSRYQNAHDLHEAFLAALRGEITPPPADAIIDVHGLTLIGELQAQQQEEAALVALAQEQAGISKTRTTPKANHFVNALLQDVGERYVGRAKQVSDLVNLLGEKTRLVSVYGRGGIGKTALVCKALADLNNSATPPHAIISLSAVGSGISLEKIFIQVGRALGGEDKLFLDYLTRDGNVPVAQKTALLLERIANKPIILYLDNLETLQDPATGELGDADLRTFFETTLTQGGDLRIIITSREPMALPRSLKLWERLVPLDEGLPTADAIALLRAADKDGTAGLRDSSADKLAILAERAGGYPRALEALVGLLLEDPLLSVDDLISDTALVTGEIAPLIVQQAIARLDNDAMRVMEGLALFGRPVSQAALEYLLSPFVNTANLRGTLARLVRAYFVSFNKATSQFALHPIDREFCYNRLEKYGVGYTQPSLHLRAADFYQRTGKPASQWFVVEDIAAQLAEFDHRVGGRDYDTAAALLYRLERDYLWEWGQKNLLRQMHAQLQGHVQNPFLRWQEQRRWVWLQDHDRELMASQYEALLAEARAAGDKHTEADLLNDIGEMHRNNGVAENGIPYHEQALAIYRELGDQRGIAEALGGIGSVVSFNNNDTAAAITLLEEARAIHKAMGNTASLTYVITILGTIYATIGDVSTSVALGEEALQLSIDTQNRIGEGRAMGFLGNTYFILGEVKKAVAYSQKSLEIGQSFKNTLIWKIPKCFLGLSLYFDGQKERALEVLRATAEEDKGFGLADLFGEYFFAIALFAEGRHEEAYQLIAKYPDSPLALRLMFAGINQYIEALSGRREPAQQYAQQIIANFETDPAKQANVGDVLEAARHYALLAALEQSEALAQKAAFLFSLINEASLGKFRGGIHVNATFVSALKGIDAGNVLAEVQKLSETSQQENPLT
jgi:serine/threonine protein kinase